MLNRYKFIRKDERVIMVVDQKTNEAHILNKYYDVVCEARKEGKLPTYAKEFIYSTRKELDEAFEKRGLLL